jgi:hypothetical protein
LTRRRYGPVPAARAASSCRSPHGPEPCEMERNFLMRGRSNFCEATVDSVAHPATGALLQGVRPFLPHRPETRPGGFPRKSTTCASRPRRNGGGAARCQRAAYVCHPNASATKWTATPQSQARVGRESVACRVALWLGRRIRHGRRIRSSVTAGKLATVSDGGASFACEQRSNRSEHADPRWFRDGV